MRALHRFSTKVARGLSLTPYSADDAEMSSPSDEIIHQRLMRSMRRRTSDDLAYLVERTCFRDDWQTASELIAVLQKVLEREQRKFSRDQRADDGLLERMKSLLEAAKCRSETSVRHGSDGQMEITVSPEIISR